MQESFPFETGRFHPLRLLLPLYKSRESDKDSELTASIPKKTEGKARKPKESKRETIERLIDS
jgi:hypothetical protein